MSFSYDVKNEISIIEPKKDCCHETLMNCYNIKKLQKCMVGICCSKTLLRQAFIEFGSVNNPEVSYHMEMIVSQEELASLICALMNDYLLGAKIMMRNGTFVIYIKSAEAVSDYLRLVGANEALMTFENVRIVKEMRKDINRVVNCESANIQKKIDAAFKQLKCITYIRDTVGLDYLPDDLKEVALARLSDQVSGFAELGEGLNKKLSKSGISHRMKRIMDIAEELRKHGVP